MCAAETPFVVVVPYAGAWKHAVEPLCELAGGLRALASMVDDYFRGEYDDGHGSVREPDEGSAACHLWNAAGAVNDDPAGISTWLYAEHGPREEDVDEIALIAAGKALATLEEAPDAR